MMDKYRWTPDSAAKKGAAPTPDKPQGQRPCFACGAPVTGDLDHNNDVVGYLTCEACGKNQFYKSRLDKEKFKRCHICKKRGHVNYDCPQNSFRKRKKKLRTNYYPNQSEDVIDISGSKDLAATQPSTNFDRAATQPSPNFDPAATQTSPNFDPAATQPSTNFDPAATQTSTNFDPAATKPSLNFDPASASFLDDKQDQMGLTERMNLFLQNQKPSPPTDVNNKCSICGNTGHDPSQCNRRNASKDSATPKKAYCDMCGGTDHRDNECIALHPLLSGVNSKGKRKKGKRAKREKPKQEDLALDVLAATTLCSNCNVLGHLSKDCTKPVKPTIQASVTSMATPCTHCGSADHPSTACSDLYHSSGVDTTTTKTLLPEERNFLCTNCGETGHHFTECSQPEMDLMCTHCGQKGHRAKMCPVCEWCGKHGHLIEACPLGPYAFNLCLKCGDKGHVTNMCPHEVFCKSCKTPGHSEDNCTAEKVGEGDRPRESIVGDATGVRSPDETADDTSSKFRICLTCGIVGHVQEECNACITCGKSGHTERDCPSDHRGGAKYNVYEDINSPPSSNWDSVTHQGRNPDNREFLRRSPDERDAGRQDDYRVERMHRDHERDDFRLRPDAQTRDDYHLERRRMVSPDGGSVREDTWIGGNRYSGEQDERWERKRRYSDENDDDARYREELDQELGGKIDARRNTSDANMEDRRDQLQPYIEEKSSFLEYDRLRGRFDEARRGSPRGVPPFDPTDASHKTFLGEERFRHADIDDIKEQFLEGRDARYSGERNRLEDEDRRYLSERSPPPSEARERYEDRREGYASPGPENMTAKTMMTGPFDAEDERIAIMQKNREQDEEEVRYQARLNTPKTVKDLSEQNIRENYIHEKSKRMLRDDGGRRSADRDDRRRRSRSSSPVAFSTSRHVTPDEPARRDTPDELPKPKPSYRQMPWEVPPSSHQHQQPTSAGHPPPSWPMPPGTHSQIAPPGNMPSVQPPPNHPEALYGGPPPAMQSYPTGPPLPSPQMQRPPFPPPPYQGQPGHVPIPFPPPTLAGPNQIPPVGPPPRMRYPGRPPHPMQFPSHRPYAATNSHNSQPLTAMDEFEQKLMEPRWPRRVRTFSSEDSLSDDSSFWDSLSSRSGSWSSSPDREHIRKRSRSRHRSRSRRRSRSRSKRGSRSRSRGQSRSRSRGRSRSRSRGRSHSRSRSPTRSRSRLSRERRRRSLSSGRTSRAGSGDRRSYSRQNCRSVSKEKRSKRSRSKSNDQGTSSLKKKKDHKEKHPSQSGAPKEQNKAIKPVHPTKDDNQNNKDKGRHVKGNADDLKKKETLTETLKQEKIVKSSNDTSKGKTLPSGTKTSPDVSNSQSTHSTVSKPKVEDGKTSAEFQQKNKDGEQASADHKISVAARDNERASNETVVVKQEQKTAGAGENISPTIQPKAKGKNKKTVGNQKQQKIKEESISQTLQQETQFQDEKTADNQKQKTKGVNISHAVPRKTRSQNKKTIDNQESKTKEASAKSIDNNAKSKQDTLSKETRIDSKTVSKKTQIGSKTVSKETEIGSKPVSKETKIRSKTCRPLNKAVKEEKNQEEMAKRNTLTNTVKQSSVAKTLSQGYKPTKASAQNPVDNPPKPNQKEPLVVKEEHLTERKDVTTAPATVTSTVGNQRYRTRLKHQQDVVKQSSISKTHSPSHLSISKASVTNVMTVGNLEQKKDAKPPVIKQMENKGTKTKAQLVSDCIPGKQRKQPQTSNPPKTKTKQDLKQKKESLSGDKNKKVTKGKSRTKVASSSRVKQTDEAVLRKISCHSRDQSPSSETPSFSRHRSRSFSRHRSRSLDSDISLSSTASSYRESSWSRDLSSREDLSEDDVFHGGGDEENRSEKVGKRKKDSGKATKDSEVGGRHGKRKSSEKDRPYDARRPESRKSTIDQDSGEAGRHGRRKSSEKDRHDNARRLESRKSTIGQDSGETGRRKSSEKDRHYDARMPESRKSTIDQDSGEAGRHGRRKSSEKDRLDNARRPESRNSTIGQDSGETGRRKSSEKDRHDNARKPESRNSTIGLDSGETGMRGRQKSSEKDRRDEVRRPESRKSTESRKRVYKEEGSKVNKKETIDKRRTSSDDKRISKAPEDILGDRHGNKLEKGTLYHRSRRDGDMGREDRSKDRGRDGDRERALSSGRRDDERRKREDYHKDNGDKRKRDDNHKDNDGRRKRVDYHRDDDRRKTSCTTNNDDSRPSSGSHRTRDGPYHNDRAGYQDKGETEEEPLWCTMDEWTEESNEDAQKEVTAARKDDVRARTVDKRESKVDSKTESGMRVSERKRSAESTSSKRDIGRSDDGLDVKKRRGADGDDLNRKTVVPPRTSRESDRRRHDSNNNSKTDSKSSHRSSSTAIISSRTADTSYRGSKDTKGLTISFKSRDNSRTVNYHGDVREHPVNFEREGSDRRYNERRERTAASPQRKMTSTRTKVSSARTRIHSWERSERPKVDLSDPSIIKITNI